MLRLGVTISVFVALLAAAASLGSAVLGAEGTPPLTLVRETGRILAFAQDDGELAWQVDAAGARSTIKLRAANDRNTAVISKPDGGDGDYYFEAFGLGGRRVVWAGFVDCCNHGYGSVETAAPGSQPKEQRGLDLEYWAWGDYPTGAAGDGKTLVYSLAAISPLDEEEDWHVTGGGVWRVVGTKSVRVPGTPPTALLAATRGTIALVPADRRRYQGPCSDDNPLGCAEVRVAPGAAVETRDVITGALRTSFVPKGRVAALGMDAETVVVIVRLGAGARVEWHSARSGKLVGSLTVAPDVSDEIDVAGRTIVLRRGKTILAVNTRTRQLRDLARSSEMPVGLSIEGTRVAWAEGASIRAVQVR